jgi:hypothetical protein
MDVSDWLFDVCTTILDVSTGIYRFVYTGVVGEGNSAFDVALVTWTAGTLGTLVAAVSIAFLWDALFWTIRWRSKSLLRVAVRGANVSTGLKMARRFAMFDQSVGVIQRMSGVARGCSESEWSQSLSASDARTWIARFVLWLPASIVGTVRFICQPVVLLLIGLSCGAVWWVSENRDLRSSLAPVAMAVRSLDFTVEPVMLSAAGVGIAVLTFFLSRFGNAKARGHQEWLRSESAMASDGLAGRALALCNANLELEDSLWAVLIQWKSTVLDFEIQSKVERRIREREMRDRLQLDASSELESSIAKNRVDYSSGCWRGPTASQRALVKFDEAVEALQDHLRQSSQRAENRLSQAAPWSVVRRARRLTLQIYVTRVASYSSDSDLTDLELSPVARWLGPLIYCQKGAYPSTEAVEDFDFSAIDIKKRQRVLENAILRWDEEVKEQHQG